MWVKTNQAERGILFYGAEVTGGDGFGNQNEFHINMRDGGQVRFFLEGGTADDMNVRTDAINDNDWHHIACTWDIAGDVTLYIDGADPVSRAHNGGNFNSSSVIYLGAPDKIQRFYIGLMDDVRLYDYPLLENEIAETMEKDTTLASEPSPANGSITDIEHATALSWLAGENASEHDVYLGTNRGAVVNAQTSTPDIYRGRYNAAGYAIPEAVQYNQTYYWRIDEVNADATVSKGYVWSFTIGNFIIVEDFEDYDDYEPDTVWNTWIDGYGDPTNGSSAGYPDPDFVAGEHYLEDGIVHGGEWSMPLFYDNSVGLSEVTRTFNANWTVNDVVTLTLFYYGDAANAAEPMYVAINGNAVITNDDADAALVTEWTPWNIPLQLLADQGVNLNNVGSMTIGFGNKTNPTAGGAGHVFFDDIRLYRSEP